MFRENTIDTMQILPTLSLLPEIASTVLPSCSWYEVLSRQLTKTTYTFLRNAYL